MRGLSGRRDLDVRRQELARRRTDPAGCYLSAVLTSFVEADKNELDRCYDRSRPSASSASRLHIAAIFINEALRSVSPSTAPNLRENFARVMNSSCSNWPGHLSAITPFQRSLILPRVRAAVVRRQANLRQIRCSAPGHYCSPPAADTAASDSDWARARPYRETL